MAKLHTTGQHTVVTMQTVESLLDSGKLYAAMNNGNWWQMRRNGQTKRWKRDSSRIYIPFKVGLKGYGSLSESDFSAGFLNPDHYRHIDDLSE